ncbi:MAG: family 43 glycosylhydrolase [Phycisphaerales bacterium]|nr:MAG: family 43 glycosylhydrolase [Phycisphaerales bacterium]
MIQRFLPVLAGTLLSLPLACEAEPSPTAAKYVGTIQNDTIWRDTHGKEIWCNGGHMIREGETFYWAGYETRPRTGFKSVRLYSSGNLADWEFENDILRPEGPFSILGWAGRPGLLHNRATKKYVLIIEADSRQWERHKVGFAESDAINGDYRFVRFVYPEPNRSTGDQSVYQEGQDGYLVCTLDKLIDGKRYLNQSLAIFRLTPDFLDIADKVYEGFDNVNGDRSVYPRHHTGREASHIIKVNSLYYWFSSGLEGWNSTQTKYATSASLAGPWSALKVLATDPISTDSLNTQHDFVIAVTGNEATTYVYVGDRYSQHHGRGIGRNIFLPLAWKDGEPMLKWHKTWRIDAATGRSFSEEGQVPSSKMK